VQVVLESPKEGRQYVFELKDRLIRDKELDGLTEIPVKQDAGENTDELEESVSSTLEGELCFVP